jgi:secondary thiamine-phosphate synthase enzyme
MSSSVDSTLEMTPAGFLGTRQGRLEVETEGRLKLHDITDDVQGFVSDSGLLQGHVVVQSMHTSAGLLLNERESGLAVDLADAAERLFPRTIEYRHDDLSVRTENICPEDAEHPNGHAHVQHMAFGAPTIVLSIIDGELLLGKWQRLLLLEFDRSRPRVVTFNAIGLIPVDGHTTP